MSAKHGDVYVKGPIELRCGDYREVLADVEPDAVITDPPYSERTHAGFLSGSADRNRMGQDGNIGYSVLTDEMAADLASMVSAWAPRWVVVWGDDITQATWSRVLSESGLYVFAPLAWVKHNTTPRLSGDGPASACEWLTVARQRQRYSCGSLPGFYMVDPVRGAAHERVVVGQKPLHGVRSVVRDYTQPGDLIVDCFSGGATTLIAAALEGRRAIGAELDPETFAKACARIERTALTPPLPGLDVERRPAEQVGLGFEEESA